MISGPFNVRSLKRASLFGVWTMLAIVLSLLAAACGGGDDLSIAKGRQLHFIAESPKVAEKVIFTDGNDNRWVIRPKASNRQIAVVQLTIANFSTTVASLLLNESAALLGDRRSDRIEPINPFESASPGDGDERGALVLDGQFLWGKVELEKDRQIEGAFIFDVPKGLILGTLWWEQTDTVSLDFVDYQRNR
jgi:hypothetical protein